MEETVIYQNKAEPTEENNTNKAEQTEDGACAMEGRSININVNTIKDAPDSILEEKDKNEAVRKKANSINIQSNKEPVLQEDPRKSLLPVPKKLGNFKTKKFD